MLSLPTSTPPLCNMMLLAQDGNFFLAKPTRFRPQGCFLRLQGDMLSIAFACQSQLKSIG